MASAPATIVIRRAEARDAGTLAAMRLASTRERHPEHGDAEAERFREACATFFATELAAPERSFMTAWLAFDASDPERALGSATLTLVPTLPRFADTGPLVDARVRNVYVEPAARSRGIARALMRVLMAEVAGRGIDRLTLGASNMGRPLYESMGFAPKPDEMLFIG